MTLLVTIVTLLATGFTVVTLLRVRAPRRRTPSSRRPAVLLIRPLDAPAEHELRNLARPIDYRGPLQHVVVSPFRPRLPKGVRWLPSDPLTANRKVGHVLYALQALRPRRRRVLVVDADVVVDGRLIDALVDGLDSGAALVTAAPSPEPGPGPGARAFGGLLTQTHHSFLALDAMRASAPAVCGKAMALAAPAQAVLGELGNHLGEDLELAQRLHARGLSVDVASSCAAVSQGRVTPRDSLSRATRWMKVLRAHRPSLQPTVPLLFAPTLPLLALTTAFSSSTSWLAMGALFAARVALSLRLSQLHGTSASLLQRALGWLLAEALLLAAWVASLRTPNVQWRGRTFAVSRGGVIRPVPQRLEVRAA